MFLYLTRDIIPLHRLKEDVYKHQENGIGFILGIYVCDIIYIIANLIKKPLCWVIHI